MPGPVPKPSSMRQRRNKVSTASVLSATPPPAEVPELPARGRRKWHPMTLAWWNDVWLSPMAPEFLQADVHGLYILADLIDAYWKRPTTTLATEIRQQRQCFGLTPIDRRRLQWEVAKVESAEARRPVRKVQPGEDPRKLLSLVNL